MEEIKREPLSNLPAKIWTTAQPKATKLFEGAAYKTGIGKLVAKAYRGPGLVLMFHEVHNCIDSELRTGCSQLHLANVVRAVQASGREIVSIDEALLRLKNPKARPFAVITFDDGYRDTQTNALPVLETFEAPMSLFVPTGMINRKINAWWLVLREVLRTRNAIDVPQMEKTFPCADLPSKTAALRQITSWIGTDQERADAVSKSLGGQLIDTQQLVDRYAMSEVELKEIAKHPLVNIGAHTESHQFLTSLSKEAVALEFAANKTFLEALLERSIDYLAYPYGTEGACGLREAIIASEAGFKASFSTRPGHLFAEHLNHLQLLPRIDVGYAPQNKSALESRINGLHRAIITKFGSPIATIV